MPFFCVLIIIVLAAKNRIDDILDSCIIDIVGVVGIVGLYLNKIRQVSGYEFNFQRHRTGLDPETILSGFLSMLKSS